MSDSDSPGTTSDSARADVAAATRLFLASSRNVPIRLGTAAVIAIAALPVLPFWLPLGWWCVVASIAWVELRLARAVQGGARLAVWEGMPAPTVALSVTTGALYTAFMALIWLTGEPV